MTNEHYFSGTPESELKLRSIQATIAGQAVDLTTANGVFSPERVDAGTRVLLSSVPAPPPGGNLLDLGCGWGPIALSLAADAPHATVWAVDVNERALDLVRRNADVMGLSNVNAVLPQDVPADISFMTIWSNPPIRVGKNELHSMLQMWMPRLEVGADAWLVVQKNLGSDSLHRWMDDEFASTLTVTRAATNKGYRVLRVRKR
ncbi:class I SAM-dependent methyltransferase [Glaciihabitans arcticus]|uniref:Class I SAM-dependent methyltransferase n=1 Tax=Glaciihabitans arcticus TaxID=2668039 RepID=A0A4Q9GP10_9MICO|nr:methyltransferase [Glaciihabitans arcticus]TBN56481.1 class I SAM-dependent methyltransferase [Glaciihabitans arcticus]